MTVTAVRAQAFALAHATTRSADDADAPCRTTANGSERMTKRELRDALKKLKLSQSEAARRLGVRQSTMYRWLAGVRKIPGPVQAAIHCWLREVRSANLRQERTP